MLKGLLNIINVKEFNKYILNQKRRLARTNLWIKKDVHKNKKKYTRKSKYKEDWNLSE